MCLGVRFRTVSRCLSSIFHFSRWDHRYTERWILINLHQVFMILIPMIQAIQLHRKKSGSGIIGVVFTGQEFGQVGAICTNMWLYLKAELRGPTAAMVQTEVARCTCVNHFSAWTVLCNHQELLYWCRRVQWFKMSTFMIPFYCKHERCNYFKHILRPRFFF